VRLTLAVQTSSRPQPELEAAIARTITERVDAGLRPLWVLELQAATDAATRRHCLDPQQVDWDDLSREERTSDKLLSLGVVARAGGYDLICREFDAYTRRWGATQRRVVAQRSFLADACFRLVVETFTPLARIEPVTSEENAALLHTRGGSLPRRAGADLLVSAGDVFLPLLRRTGRGGELADGGVSPLPWTYLVAAQSQEGAWRADVKTALRQPLAIRRRGNIEQVAIALRDPGVPARVRFYARSKPEQGLAGYEIFRVADKAPPTLVAITDREGVAVIPRGDEPVTPLVLRSDGQVLAKLMVASGAADVLQAPIADDAIRLAAQGEVQAVREELIDVVARRAILIARVQSLLKNGKALEASELMDELNDLPTPSVFANRIDDVRERLPASDDPQVRQTVDGLFSATRELLSRFLDARVITNLQAEVNQAVRGG
jgi:hypothetical protein